jgi:hypothetical protein
MDKKGGSGGWDLVGVGLGGRDWEEELRGRIFVWGSERYFLM